MEIIQYNYPSDGRLIISGVPYVPEALLQEQRQQLAKRIEEAAEYMDSKDTYGKAIPLQAALNIVLGEDNN